MLPVRMDVQDGWDGLGSGGKACIHYLLSHVDWGEVGQFPLLKWEVPVRQRDMKCGLGCAAVQYEADHACDGSGMRSSLAISMLSQAKMHSEQQDKAIGADQQPSPAT